MDKKGYDTILYGLESWGITETEVTPVPADDFQDVRFLDIRIGDGIAPATALNALRGAGLMESDRPQIIAYDDCPQLKVLGIAAGVITFEDMNFGARSNYWA